MQKEGTKHIQTKITECRNAEQNINMQIGKKKTPRGNHFPFFPPHAENISFSNIMVTRG